MRFLFKLIGVLIAAVLVAVIGLLLLPGDKIASIAATQISKQTGRTVTITGDTSISFYPTLGVVTGPATIATAEWATEGPLLQADSLAIGIDVPALLTGTIRIRKLEAQAPRIVLERAADGSANWELTQTQDATPQETQTPAATETTTEDSYTFSLEQALIRNASLLYVDKVTGTRQMVRDVSIDAAWPDTAGIIDLRLAATPFDQEIVLTAAVNDVLSFTQGAQIPLQGTLATGNNTASFAGTASLAPSIAMQITADAPKVAQILQAAGVTPDSLGLPSNFDATAKLATNVTFQNNRFALRGLQTTVNGSTLDGDADIELTDALPSITAKIGADLTDIGALMRLGGFDPANLGLDPAFTADAKANATIQTTGTNAIVKVTDMIASLGESSVSGKADISLQNNVPTVETEFNISAPDVANIAKLLGQPLTAFGLSANASPAVNAIGRAQVNGTDINANLTSFSANLAGAKVTGPVTFALTNGAPNLNARIAANIPSTAKLMTALGQAAPDLPRGTGQSIAFNGGVTFQGQTLALKDFTATLDQNTLSGSANIALRAKPYVTATLNAGALDLSSIGAGEDDSSQASAGSIGWSKDRIDFSALGLIDGNISINWKSLAIADYALGGAAINLTIDNARAVAKIGHLGLFGGQVAGEVIANNRNGFSSRINMSAGSIDLRTMLGKMADLQKISGKATGAINVLAVGNSVDALMRSLDGSLNLTVPQGTVSGVDLEGLIRQGNANANDTVFTNLGASGIISRGVFRNADLTAITGRMDVEGQGLVDLGNQSIDYLLTPIVKDVGDRSKVALPVRIKGPWSAPKIRPDLEAAINLEAQREKLEEQARQEIEREKQKLRQKAEDEARKLEEIARKKAEEAARQAAQRAADKLKLDQATQQRLQDAAKGTLENEVRKGLKNLLGGN